MSRYETFHKPRVDLHKYSIWNYAILSLSKLANHEHLKQLKNSRVILQDITVMSAKTHGSFTFKTWFSLGGGPAPFDLKMVGEKIQNISVFRAANVPFRWLNVTWLVDCEWRFFGLGLQSLETSWNYVPGKQRAEARLLRWKNLTNLF